MEYSPLLIIITALTSFITAITGVGGGMTLIAILPSFLPAHILIPVHGVTQLFSNISRASFGYKEIYFDALPKYLLGSLVGVTFFSSLLLYLSFTYIPLFIGVYILLSLWSRKFDLILKKFESYYIMGFLQSGLSLFVGATGPMSMPMLMKDCKDPNQVVVTVAALSSITHTLKIFVFIALGFAFFDYLELMILMVVGSVLGSYLGTLVRKKINIKHLVLFIKILLSCLAIKSIYQVLI